MAGIWGENAVSLGFFRGEHSTVNILLPLRFQRGLSTHTHKKIVFKNLPPSR